MSSRHYSEDDLTLYYYGEGRRRAAIERHLDTCAPCAALYREIAGTLALIAAPEVPERGDQYGLEVWQRIRHKLPEQDVPWWAGLFRVDLASRPAIGAAGRPRQGRSSPWSTASLGSSLGPPAEGW